MKIKREIYAKLLKELNEPEILILTGARQVGKTFLLNELEKHVKLKNKRTQYFNLELPKDSLIFNKDTVELYDLLTTKTDYLFIDEFQYFENASKFFKAVFDDRNLKVKIIASGSSSLEMHKHLKESLAGRKYEKIIYPLSYLEFSQTKESFEKYLVYGGLPGLISKRTIRKKIELLNNLLETYILKDVKALIKEENISAFNNLIFLLASYQGQLVSINNLSNGLKVDNKTIERYISILEKTFVLYSLPSYSGNLSNELKKSKKYYFYDIGIRNLITTNFKPLKLRGDKGIIYETFVHNFLKHNLSKNMKLLFWRTRDGDEVDFVMLKNLDPYIFEVKSKINSFDIPNGIKKFIRSYPNTKKAFVINENLSGMEKYNNIKVHFLAINKLEYSSDIKNVFEVFS